MGLERCDSCYGKKRLLGMGGIYVDCKPCGGKGWHECSKSKVDAKDGYIMIGEQAGDSLVQPGACVPLVNGSVAHIIVAGKTGEDVLDVVPVIKTASERMKEAWKTRKAKALDNVLVGI